jgi:hypothetical protein
VYVVGSVLGPAPPAGHGPPIKDVRHVGPFAGTPLLRVRRHSFHAIELAFD